MPSFDKVAKFHVFRDLHCDYVLVTMLIKVKTLTGKEIEIDIEPTDKVERIKVRQFVFALSQLVINSFQHSSLVIREI